MKKFSKLLLVLTITAFLSACKKNQTTFDSYIYTTISERALALYIDNKYLGELPIVNCKTTEATESQKQLMFHTSLPSGKYKISAKDAEGKVYSETYLKIKGRPGCMESGMHGGVGGAESVVANNVMIFCMF